MAGNAVTVEGWTETERALQGVRHDLEPGGAVDEEAGTAVALELVGALLAAAEASGVPVAPRVSRSVRVQGGKRPTVSIGGGQAVGRAGAPAYKLVWGSERGPAGDPNHFAVPRGPGYWIKPAIDRVSPAGRAAFDLAIAGRIRHHGL